MKKTLSILLAVLCVCSVFSAGCFCASADDEDGWTTVSVLNADVGHGYAEISAKGNDLRITITSDWIVGDTIYCGGTEGCVSDEWEDAIGRHALMLDFADYDTIQQMDYSKNALRFSIRHDCGKHQSEHSFSLKNDAYIFLNYYFYSEETGQYVGKMAPGYYGSLDECTAMDISVYGNTITVTTTLPATVADKNGNSKELCFDSEHLQCVGLSTAGFFDFGEDEPAEPEPEKPSFIQVVILRIKILIQRIRILLEKLFHPSIKLF